MVIVKDPNEGEQSPFVKDKSILEKPNDDMVIVKEPPPDEDFVESGDAYLTISASLKELMMIIIDIQNVEEILGSELIMKAVKKYLLFSCAKHSENGVNIPSRHQVKYSYIYPTCLRIGAHGFRLLIM
ncbi:MAG: hypothetical protein P0116_02890 [Candidatus Nitrosocosmicus sp.]|nr:hypothetical protein [Candidatus Nitrosocosmicus sp.]